MTDDRRSRPTSHLRVAVNAPSVDTSGTWFEPARLARARVLADLDIATLAAHTGIGSHAIHRYEAGADQPEDALPKLASTLRVPAAYFRNGRPLARIDRADIHFSRFRSTSATERTKAAAHAEQMQELAWGLGRRIQLPELNLPTVEKGSTPADAARTLRRHWGVPRGPLAHLGATMESHGIILCAVPSADNVLRRVGTYSTQGSGRPFVAIPPVTTSSVYDIRFSYAHELAHLLLHPDPIPGDYRQEHEAHRFALELLIPQAEITPLLPTRPDRTALPHLVRQWGVPPAALIDRIDEADADGAARRRFSIPEPLNDSLSDYPGEAPGLLREAFARLGRTGCSELAEELHWAPDYLRRVLGDAEPGLELTLVP